MTYHHGQKQKPKRTINHENNSCVCDGIGCGFRLNASKSKVELAAHNHCDETGHRVFVMLRLDYEFNPRS